MKNLQTLPFFSIENYNLRRIKPNDAQAYFRYMNHAAVKEYLSKGIAPNSLEEARNIIDYYSKYTSRVMFWGIATKNNDLLIGSIGFNFIDLLHKKGEISFDLDYDYWGKKIMKNSIEKILQFAKDLELIRVQATSLEGNTRSINLLEKFGFEKEGVLKKYEINEKNQNSLMYSLIVQDK